MPNGRHLNLNTILVLGLGALMAFGLRKMDENYTALIQVRTQQEIVLKAIPELSARVTQMEVRMASMQVSIGLMNP